MLRLSHEIGEQTKETLQGQQREALLREQMRTIQRQLGEGDGRPAEIEELRLAIADAHMPPEAEDQAKKELARLERMPEAAAEYSMVRTYLDWLIELPWSKSSDDVIDLALARAVLDEDHYGLEKVKRRILESLAVRKLNPEGKSPILCFVGPPGVGKTRSARALRAPPGASSCGSAWAACTTKPRSAAIGARTSGRSPATSCRDAQGRDAQLRCSCSTRSTSSAPAVSTATRLQRCWKCSTRNRTRPSATTTSPCPSTCRVMFITTANVLDTIPGPLRDRMEVLQLPGYTETEKLQIAQPLSRPPAARGQWLEG